MELAAWAGPWTTGAHPAIVSTTCLYKYRGAPPAFLHLDGFHSSLPSDRMRAPSSPRPGGADGGGLVVYGVREPRNRLPSDSA